MKKTIKKSVSFLLVFVMVLSIFTIIPFTALAANEYTINSTVSTDNYYNLISKKDWDIAPGITESEIVLNNDEGSRRQVLFVMEADLNNEYVKVTHSYTGMVPEYGSYTTGVMSQQASWAEANGYGNVVGAMNTCLSWYTGYSADRVGEPLGFIMMDAEILFDPANCGYNYGNVGFPSVVVINKDFDENGNPRPADIPKVEMPQIRSAADLDGWEDQVIPCSSGYIVKDGVNQNKTPNHSDAAPRSVVGIKPDGTVVIMLNDGRQAPYSAGMSMYELAEVMIDLGCSFAVNCDGGGSSTYLSQRPGEELKVNNSPSDGAERPTTSGILFYSTAPANGEFYKAHISSDNEYYTPNSKVQFDAIGTDMGGTEVDIPEDAQWQLSDSSFGTIDSNGLFVSNGKEGEVAAQLVYNGEVVGEAAITIVLPDIAFKNDTIVIGYGDSTVLPIEVTTNEGRNTVTYSPGDIVYTLSDNNLGTLDGDNFTACDASTGLANGTITAVICGQTEKTITAEIRFGKASEIVYDFEDGEFLVDTDPEVAPAEGEPYGWFIRDTRSNGHFAYRFFAKKSYTPVGLDIPASVYLVDKNSGLVRNGNYAMGVDIDWTNVTASCHGQMDIFFPESIDITDATSVGLWMYIPAEFVTKSVQFRVGFRKADGSSASVNTNYVDMVKSNSGIDNGGWVYLSWDVDPSYKTFEYVQINSHYTAGEGNYNYYQDMTFYMDDITVDYSDATIDRENPYFTSMTIADEYTNGVEINGQTINTNTVTLMAQAYENTAKLNATGLDRNSVKLYVDGVLSDAEISVALNGTISVSDLYLNDGVHTLVMEISDVQGNVGNIVRKLVVNTEKSAVRLEVPVATSLLPTGSVYWLNVVADDLANIDSVSTTITLDYVNDWELEGMEVAYGFEADYYINNHNDAVITFTRTGTEIADTTVLAKLPVRIWTAKGWLDDSGVRASYISNDPAKQDKYYILTPHAMWYSDGTRDYRLVVGAEAGVVTYLDGSTTTFSALDTVIQTEMNRYYTNSSRQGKWSFHICTPGTAQDKAATCTESGYEGRIFCVGCACGSVENLGAQCDTHNGCGSVVDWGTIIPALGHSYEVVDGKLTCVNGGELFNGIYTDGKTYVEGVVVADGWNADGTSYYIDGVKLTGSHIIDKAVYTFDENGTYMPEYIYNGFITENGETMYFYTNTNYEVNYLYIDNKAYHFTDGIAKDGLYTINGETCLFEGGVYISCDTADVMDAGWMGQGVTYIIYSDGSMILGGEGPTYKYTSRAQLPWVIYKTKIYSIFIGKDITALNQFALADIYLAKTITFEDDSKLSYIGPGAILSCYGITEIVLPDSLETIVQNAFKMCKNLVDVYLPYNIKYLHKLSFVNNQNVPMPQIKFHVFKGTYSEDYAKQYNIPYEYRVFVDKVVASGTCGADATWDLYQSGKLVIGGSGAMDNYTSKETTPWAAYINNITDVVIGKDITSVGNFAFAYVLGINTVTFEEGSKLETIGAASFLYVHRLTEIVVPETVTKIGNNAFSYCKALVNITIPQDVKLIYPTSFTKCENVVLNVAEGTYGKQYAISSGLNYTTRAYVDGVVATGTCGENATWTLYKSGKMVIAGFGAMDNYTGKENTPWYDYLTAIKDIIIGKDITHVGNFAFAYATMAETLTFEEGSVLETVGAASFLYLHRVTEIVVPETVTKIGNNAFSYCKALVNITIPQDVKLIYPTSFTKCANVVLNVAEGTYGKQYAISSGLNYTTRAYVDGVVATGTCGENATWTLYKSGNMIIGGSGAMDNYTGKENTPWYDYLTKITDITIGKDITHVGNFAFAYATMAETLTFEEGSALETVGAASFLYLHKVTKVVLPETVTKIGNNAFAYGKALVSINIPESVTLIYPASFNKCNANLKMTVASGSYGEKFAISNNIAYIYA